MPQPRRSSTFAICLPAISSYCSCPWLAPGIDSRKTRRIRAENFGSTGYSGAWPGCSTPTSVWTRQWGLRLDLQQLRAISAFSRAGRELVIAVNTGWYRGTDGPLLTRRRR